ncbi:hypothetical protein HMI55_003388, partial [Coelomomyces lativittatus]
MDLVSKDFEFSGRIDKKELRLEHVERDFVMISLLGSEEKSPVARRSILMYED